MKNFLKFFLKEVKTDEYVFINTDCIFNHDLKGNNLVNGKIVNNLYVDATGTDNNLDSLDESTDSIAYYYYNYTTRYRQGLSEKLFFGHDGTLEDRLGDSVQSNKTLVTVNAVSGIFHIMNIMLQLRQQLLLILILMVQDLISLSSCSYSYWNYS